jgi:atypical dual specificity phosphatase
MTQASGGRAFDWLIPDQLAACVDPVAGVQAAEQLRTGNVTLLINLYERPDPPELLQNLGAETLHLPVHNSDAPTQAQLDRGVAAITQALQQGKRVAVHCGAGLGRSGTLLAAYLVSQGSDAEDALARVRAARPGSVETLEQENAVREYQRRLQNQGGAT